MGRSSGSRISDGHSQAFPATSRLKQRDEFSRVFKQGRVAVDDCLVVHAVRHSVAQSKLGLSIPKKVGSAPLRNRWKRLVREAFRLNQLQLPNGLAMVVRPRRGATPELRKIEQSLIRLARKLDRKL